MSNSDAVEVERQRTKRFNGLTEIVIAGIVIAGLSSSTWVPAVRDIYVSTANAYAEGRRAEAGFDLQTGDYNGNSQMDTFYQIGNTRVPVEVDGKPISSYVPGARK